MSKFDGYSHEQLWAMVSGANEHVLKTRATSLVDAAKTIHDVGDALKKHKVQGWDGEAAQAFHDWVSQAGSATLRLAEYSKAGGESLGHAADVLSEVKKSALYDATEDAALRANIEAARKHHNDPDAPIVRKQSTDTLTANQERAAAALLKLAERYDQSAKEMKAVEVPTFPPPPGDFVPSSVSEMRDSDRSGDGLGGTGASSYVPRSSSVAASHEPDWSPGRTSRPDAPLPPTIGPGSTPAPVVPDHAVDVDLDHVATLPETSLPPSTSIPGPGPVPGGPTPGGTPPPLTFPPMAGGGPGLPGIGPGGLPPGIAPGGKVGGKIGGLAPVLPRDAGIVGGRQVPVSGPSGSIPRGTVIGEGMQGGGRGMMGGGMGGGGLGGSHSGPGGSMAGRRLAMEQGGVVGGRQPGVGGGRSTTGGQPFTQGGSGLVRNGSGTGPVGGAMGRGGAGVGSAGRRRDEQGGERPDYLSEDEETWQANRRVVPPVID
ncbi:WXG100 family type VII secretion target [Streptomyces goshikiensis]|uniref:WXG100 family type VII secretion target n=1 Tax=Streptomyces goshikiensis TaxID=1942 RepID=UPI0036A2085E